MSVEGDIVPNPESYAPRSSLVVLPDGSIKDTHNSRGNLEVAIQDQFSSIVDLYIHEHIGSPITLTSPTAIDGTDLNVQAGHGAVAGNLICIKENARFYQGEVLSTTATTIALDTPLDYAFSAGAICTATTKQMAVDGSSATKVFHAKPGAGVKWDITRMLFFLEGTAAMDNGKFGDIASLTNGIVVRKKDGTYKNIFNAKNNGDFATRAYDITYDAKAPAGTTAVRVRRTFAGPDKNGVTIRLDGDAGDELEILIRDDLTGMVSFNAIAQGHVVED